MERSSGLRFLADENIAASAIDSLRSLGGDVVTVDDRRLQGFPDHRLLDAATAEHRAILTQDTDFGTLAIAQGAPCFGIILVRPGDLLPSELLALVADFLRADAELPAPFIVALERGRTRVRALTEPI